MHGSCHCGAVQVRVAHPPAEVTECRCSICRRYGAQWAYYRLEDFSLTGPTEVYTWGRRHVAFHRCATCGCVAGWLPRGDYPECAVNARLLDGFDPESVALIIEEDASM
jgi:hypothetical protein